MTETDVEESTTHPPAAPGASTALLTDHYELTMLDAALHAGVADRRCIFELFARDLPDGRRYGVVMGVRRALDLLGRYRFDEGVLAHLRDRDVIRPATAEWAADHVFGGTITAFRDGEVHVGDEPVLTVDGTFGDAVVLETLLLSVLNHDSAIAAAASRMISAARGRALLEFGSRRTHEQAAVDAGAVAVALGFTGTSNLEAGRRHGVATLGTSAHAFTQLFADERTAFEAQVAAMGTGTTLLVDTYDIPTGIENAVKAAGTGLGAIRIDSGELHAEAVAARAQLDALGATDTRVVVSGDLDEHGIEHLADAPVDGYGVGTNLVGGSGHPTAGFVYKLVARCLVDADDLQPVAKDSEGKATRGGRKHVWRRLRDGTAVQDVATTDPAPLPDARRLQVPVVRDGRRVDDDLPTPAEHHAAALAELPPEGRDLSPGPACLTVTLPD